MSESSYGPETLHLLAQAYDSAIRALPEVEGRDVLREELARSILNLADLGIIDLEQLRDGALGKVEARLRVAVRKAG